MAAKTPTRRATACLPLLPFRGVLPFPDGSVTAGDRQAVAFLYAGVVNTAEVITDATFTTLELTRFSSGTAI